MVSTYLMMVMFLFPKNKELIKENSKYLKNNFLTDELIDHRFNYLNNDFTKFNKLSLYEKIFKHKYCLFTKNELDIIMDECIEMIITKIKEVMQIIIK